MKGNENHTTNSFGINCPCCGCNFNIAVSKKKVSTSVEETEQAVELGLYNPNLQLTENFNLSEFHSKDGQHVPEMYLENVKLLAVQLQKIRDHYGRSVTINSGYRSKSHNDSLPNASPNSQHLKAKAADIVVSGVSANDVADLLEEWRAAGVIENGGIGRYNGRTHYDVRGYASNWDLR